MNNTIKITLQWVVIPLIQTYQSDIAISKPLNMIHIIYFKTNILM